MSETDFFKMRSVGNLQPPPPEVNLEEFRKVIESRRSIRVFDGTPIPEGVTRECLRLALLAPNSSNLQPWEFYWVRSKEKKQKLVEACLSQPAAETAAELIVCVARRKTWRAMAARMLAEFSKAETPPPAAVITYYKKLVPLAYTVGPFGLLGLIKKMGMFLIGLNRPVPREPTSISDMKIWSIKSTALACENLMLAFRASGFDSCPMEGMDSRRVRKLLNLAGDASVVMVISAGRRKPEGVYGPQIRFDSKHFIHEI
jgi:nitroreductase